MNKSIKCFLIVLLEFMIFSLSGCSWFKESASKARETTEEFFRYITDDDYESAGAILHKQSYPTTDGLFTYIANQEEQFNVDFSEGVLIKGSSNFSMAGYDSEYNGSSFEIRYKASIGKVSVEIYIHIIDNDDGYGIYRFGLE